MLEYSLIQTFLRQKAINCKIIALSKNIKIWNICVRDKVWNKSPNKSILLHKDL